MALPQDFTLESLTTWVLNSLQEGHNEQEVEQIMRDTLRQQQWNEQDIDSMTEEVSLRVARAQKPTDQAPNQFQQMMDMMQSMLKRMEKLEGKEDPNPSETATEDESRTTASAENKDKAGKFPHPDPFSGDRTKYPAFRYKTKAKLNNDFVHKSEQYKIDYVMGRMADYAANVVLPWAESHSGTATMTDMWAYLDQQFDDPHLKAKAIDQLSSLKQGKRSVRDYHMEFNRLMLQTGEVFSEANKKNWFLRGLNNELQRMLATIDEDVSFEVFVNKAVRTSDNLYRATLHNKLSKSPTTTQNATSTTKETPPEPMDWTPTRSQAQAQGKRATWVSQQTINKRREKGECIRCGKKGHYIQRCPLLPAQRPDGTSTVAQVKTEDDGKETDTESDNESEKE